MTLLELHANLPYAVEYAKLTVFKALERLDFLTSQIDSNTELTQEQKDELWNEAKEARMNGMARLANADEMTKRIQNQIQQLALLLHDNSINKPKGPLDEYGLPPVA